MGVQEETENAIINGENIDYAVETADYEEVSQES
jgi:hypothetical protein